MSVRCESCKGVKKMMGLGMVMVDCKGCEGKGILSKPELASNDKIVSKGKGNGKKEN